MATSKTAQCDGSVTASVEDSMKGRSLRKGKDKDCTCPICDDQILDAKGRRKGHDAIFCDGTCQTWLHRGCAGLSRRAFEAQVGSRGEFFVLLVVSMLLRQLLRTLRGNSLRLRTHHPPLL